MPDMNEKVREWIMIDVKPFNDWEVLLDHDESPTKKSFLRKGSGLARFGGVGGPPKRMTRSKSQVLSRDKTIEKSKFGGSCPRF